MEHPLQLEFFFAGTFIYKSAMFQQAAFDYWRGTSIATYVYTIYNPLIIYSLYISADIYLYITWILKYIIYIHIIPCMFILL